MDIDESKFGRSKYRKGRELEGKWVFGAYERESKKLLLFPVDKKNGDTLCEQGWPSQAKHRVLLA